MRNKIFIIYTLLLYSLAFSMVPKENNIHTYNRLQKSAVELDIVIEDAAPGGKNGSVVLSFDDGTEASFTLECVYNKLYVNEIYQTTSQLTLNSITFTTAKWEYEFAIGEAIDYGEVMQIKGTWSESGTEKPAVTIGNTIDDNITIVTTAHSPMHLSYFTTGEGRIQRYISDPGKESRFFYITDHLGSTRMVIDEKGEPVENTMYYSYGKMDRIYVSSEDPAREKFTGKEFDTEGEGGGVGLYHFGARYYDPEIGFWTSVDPSDQFWSPYSYAGNGFNPVNAVDYDGEVLWFVVGAGVVVAWQWGNAPDRDDETYRRSEVEIAASTYATITSPVSALSNMALHEVTAKVQSLGEDKLGKNLSADPEYLSGEEKKLKKNAATGIGIGAALEVIGDALGDGPNETKKNNAAKRGPKTDPKAPHNKKINDRIETLKSEGHAHTHGGTKKEEYIRTPGGKKSARRLDITTRDPNDNPYRENVGRTKKDGTPIKREVDALDDLENATGSRPNFTPYD